MTAVDPIRRALDQRLTRRTLLAAAGGLSAATLLDACLGQSTPQSKPSTSILMVGTPTFSLQTADPHVAFYTADLWPVMFAISEGLVRRDLNGKLVPNLASSWTTSADGLTWTFSLRGGVKMHDGSAFTARDVQTAIRRVGNPRFAGGFAPLTAALANIRVVDDLHVELTTKQPFATLLDYLPAPIPTAYYMQVGDTQFGNAPMAAGAFKFVSQQPNQNIILEKFDGYWDSSRTPNFKTLHFQVIPDESTRVAGLQAGQLDAALALSAASATQLQGASGVRLIKTENATLGLGQIDQLAFPSEPSPLLDVRVRQALLLAVDRATIAKNFYKGLATVLPNLTLPITLGNDPKLTAVPYNPAKAKQLLTASGQSGMTLTLQSKAVDAFLPDIQSLCQTLISYWQAIGIKVQYQGIESTTYLTIRRSRKMRGLSINGYTPSVMYEPSRFAGLSLVGSVPNGVYSDPRMDAMIRQMDATVNIADRTKLGTDFSHFVYDNLVMLPLFGMTGVIAIGKRIADVKLQAANPTLLSWYLRAA